MKEKPKGILSFFLVLLLLCVQGFIAPYKPLTVQSADVNIITSLGFTPKHTVIDPTKSIIYSIDSSQKRVYSINYETKVISSISFSLTPERLYYSNNTLYVALLKSGHHYYSTIPEQGAVAVIDTTNFTLKEQFNVDIDPYDMVVDREGFLHITSGSNQWTSMKSYSTITKKKIGETFIRMSSYAALHPTMSKIYTITTDSSPRDLNAYIISNGTYPKGSYDSPYHGDHPMNINFRISPDGKFIFNGSGNVFSCSNSQGTDINYVSKLDSSFKDIAFNLEDGIFYTASTGKQIKIYDYITRTQTGTYMASGDVRTMFFQNNKLVALSIDSNDKWKVEAIPKSSIGKGATVNYPPADGANRITTYLDFIPKQTVADPTKPIVYAIDDTLNRVYSINYETKAVSSLDLNLPPGRLYYSNNTLYVSFSINGHIYHSTDPEEGAIAIIDATTLTLKDQFYIDIDPYDMVVDHDGYIHVVGGSNQWTSIKSFSAITKSSIGSAGIRYQSNAQLHPSANKIYTISTRSTPRDIYVFTIANGTYPGPNYDSPYHGDYIMNKNFKISPDGYFIFNGAGTIFTSSLSRENDIIYVTKLDNSFTDIAFNLNNDKFYLSDGKKQINIYSYVSLKQTSSFTTDGDVRAIFYENNKFIAVTKNTYGNWQVETIDYLAGDSNPGDIDSPPGDADNPPGDVDNPPDDADNPPDYDDNSPAPTQPTKQFVDSVYNTFNNKAYVIYKNPNTLSVIDMKTNEIENEINLTYSPSALCISEDGTKLYIANDNTDYLITEITLSNYSTRHSLYKTQPNHNHFAFKRIYHKGNRLYVVTGETLPKLLLFNSSTLQNISYGTELTGIGALAFSKNGEYLYAAGHSSWNTGYRSASIRKYGISGDRFNLVDQYSTETVEMNHNTFRAPVLLLEDYDLLIYRDNLYFTEMLEINFEYFNEPIYAINPTFTAAVSEEGIYYLDYDIFLYFEDDTARRILYFNNDGVLYTFENNEIVYYFPLYGDMNGDIEIDIKDIAAVASSYGAKKGDTNYNFIRDLNNDNIIDIYDIVTVSKLIDLYTYQGFSKDSTGAKAQGQLLTGSSN
jgi:hypothetical protein